jgi:RHS repeat-associated protein
MNCLLASARATGRGWYLTDHLGTVRDITNEAGAVIAHLDYSSFGQMLGVSNPGAVDRFGFTGRELDSEFGAYFLRSRYYSPGLGRFISIDPVGFSSGEINLYRYTLNSPCFFRDVFGTSVLSEYTVLATTEILKSVFSGFIAFLACQALLAHLRGRPSPSLTELYSSSAIFEEIGCSAAWAGAFLVFVGVGFLPNSVRSPGVSIYLVGIYCLLEYVGAIPPGCRPTP